MLYLISMNLKFLLFSLLLHGLGLLVFQIPQPNKIEVIVERPNFTIEIIDYEKPKKLIVQKQKNNEVPEDADFLSSHNQKVKKQTSGSKNLSLKDLAPKFEYSLLKSNLGSTPNQNSPSGDKIENVDLGFETAVNSKEFVYFSFYTRIRERLEAYWHPGVRDTLNNLLKTNSISLSQNRRTRLLITLNPQGQLIKVQVLSPSGIIDLDDEAINAFKKAEPFPNPPKGLVEEDGNIKINWDFIVER
jgi:TonB family protein